MARLTTEQIADYLSGRGFKLDLGKPSSIQIQEWLHENGDDEHAATFQGMTDIQKTKVTMKLLEAGQEAKD